jgi:hypothetical protein
MVTSRGRGRRLGRDLSPCHPTGPHPKEPGSGPLGAPHGATRPHRWPLEPRFGHHPRPGELEVRGRSSGPARTARWASSLAREFSLQIPPLLGDSGCPRRSDLRDQHPCRPAMHLQRRILMTLKFFPSIAEGEAPSGARVGSGNRRGSRSKVPSVCRFVRPPSRSSSYGRSSL